MSQSKSSKPKYQGSSAVALKYNPEKDNAPIVVASGHGLIAEKIIRIADQNGVPVYRDDSAAALLTMLDLGTPIPPELYQVVASIYAEIIKIADEIKKNQEVL
ncbi:MAG TPA: EscU/YscU/HrcU family type III secretion system export apparatus switch protein [Oscillospiraceae bacterium]|jgi:flagellar biosynthesis protein|nr:EscU/YscU/HrcU family type III secretion system export apparatus switch protein [Oscillospiraceae bacterium]